jgi:hypothetical protein
VEEDCFLYSVNIRQRSSLVFARFRFKIIHNKRQAFSPMNFTSKLE